jgi:high-affinity nickel-transport protein
MAPDFFLSLPAVFLATGATGAVGVIGGALALGIRHGIDWDHIAAITDITSTAAVTDDEEEPEMEEAVHHHHHERAEEAPAILMPAALAAGAGGPTITGWLPPAVPRPESKLFKTMRRQRRAISLGTIYALGHGTMVIALGLAAILFSEILPSWVDSVMEKVVGITLLFLGVYLLVSLYRYFRGGGEFRIRSRWMLIFAGARRAGRRLRRLIPGAAPDHHHHGTQPHDHDHAPDQYGVGTSYSIGLLHGIGAETGTQVLIIGTAVGAASKGMAVTALFTFVLGLLISNSLVIGLTAAGFTSARKREGLYVAAGAIAAVFSLFLGALYLSQSGDILPDLDPLVRWVGGPSA